MEQEIKKTLAVLKKGGIILYPTDTVWGIGCDARNEQAVEKIYALKKRAVSKSMIVLVYNDFQLEQIITEVPELAWELIDQTNKPLTLVLDGPRNIAKNLIAKDNSLGVRIVQDEFCKRLIRELNAPLVSTSANLSNEPTPAVFTEISPYILDGVDYIVNLHQNKRIRGKSSTVIRLKNNGEVKILRK